MAGDKTYITDGQGKLHRATRVHAVTPTDIVWSSNPNDYTVQVKIDGKWHRAVLTMDAGSSTFFDNINIDKALVTGADGKQHTALIVKPESTVTLSDIKTDTHGTIAGTTTGETAVSTYSENWSDVKWQDNVNVYKVLVTGSDGKVHTALLTTSAGGGVQVIVLGPSPLNLPDAIANSLSYVKAFGGTEQRNIPQPYTQVNYVTNTAQTAIDTGVMIDFAKNYEFELECRAVSGSWYILQSRASASGNVTGIHGETSGSNIKLVVGNVTVCTSAITRTIGNKLYVKATLNAGTATLYVKDETANTEDTQTGSYGTTQPNPTAAVYLLGNAGGQYADINSDIYMARIKENGVTVMDYVPARQVATAGFYDTVSGTFKTALTPANLSADGNTVPTPDAPMDIVSNNGVLKARHQSGLPLGYTLLDYVESTGTQYVNTGVAVNANTRVTAEFEFTSSTFSTRRLFGKIAGASTGALNYREYASFYWFKSNTITASSVGKHIVDFKTDDNVYLDGAVIGTKGTFSGGSNLPMYLFAELSDGGNINYGSVKVYRFTIFEDTAVVQDLIPCKNASNIVGMYDLVSGQFFTNAGTGDFVAGSTVSDPVEIYTDGTVETINMHGKNLFDKNNTLTGYYDASGVWSNTAGFSTADYIPAKPNTTYVSSIIDILSSSTGFRMHAWDKDHNWLGQVASTIQSQSGQLTVISGTTPANTTYLSLGFSSGHRDINTCQLELGSTATEYAPYYNGGTATAEMLLKVGDYQDEQEILSGVVTRNVGVKVFDGTEDWTRTAVRTLLILTDSAIGSGDWAPYCTHYQGYLGTAGISNMPDNSCKVNTGTNQLLIKDATHNTDIDTWKQYLADQYAAGTPVIIVYPLATPTTESVAGQTLQVTSGDNVLEITQASLSGLELEAEYQKVA